MLKVSYCLSSFLIRTAFRISLKTVFSSAVAVYNIKTRNINGLHLELNVLTQVVSLLTRYFHTGYHANPWHIYCVPNRPSVDRLSQNTKKLLYSDHCFVTLHWTIIQYLPFDWTKLNHHFKPRGLWARGGGGWERHSAPRSRKGGWYSVSCGLTIFTPDFPAGMLILSGGARGSLSAPYLKTPLA